jgi:hypothetical protein
MISVSIVTYHTSTDELDRCLASLDSPLVSHIDIIDNGSEERLRQYFADKPKVTYRQAPNPGFGAAHNLSLMHTAEPYHLVLNSDVHFAPAVLETLVTVMERNKQVAQIQPRVLNSDGTLQYGSRRLPTPLILIGRRFLPASVMRKINHRYLLQDLDLNQPLNVPYQCGCFMLIRTACIRQIGGFDERYFMYPEDIDLSRRLRSCWPVIYYPAVSITHAHGKASYTDTRMLRIHAQNMLRYFRKWGFVFDGERRRLNREIKPYQLED